MAHDITLYGFGPTRSARCRWTLLELGLPFAEIDDRALVGSERLRAFHPQAKLPAIEIDGEALFESAAICTHLADLVPEAGLIGSPGTRARALHEQWSCFVLSEMEAWLWSTAKHTTFYPEEKRVPAVVATNTEEFRNGAAVLERVLGETPFLVEGRFGVTDIVVGWAVNWGRRMGQLDGFDNLRAYLDRLFAREHCTLNPE
jgi:glutathione S-transferase